MNVYSSLATLAFLLIWAAWFVRRRRKQHVQLAMSGITVDLAVVLILEFQRDVIGMTFERSWSWQQWTHIGSSVVAVALYVPVVWLGVQLLRGRATASVRKLHARLAESALVFRTIGFCFMWLVVKA